MTFHCPLNGVLPLKMPLNVRVRFCLAGLLVPENVITVVTDCPGARLPRLCGNGVPFVVGDTSVAVVSLTLLAVTPPLFFTVTPIAIEPQLLRTRGVMLTTRFAGPGLGVGVGVGVGDGDGDGFGDGDGDGVGVGVGVGVGPPGCNSKAPMSVLSAAFATAGSSNVRAKT